VLHLCPLTTIDADLVLLDDNTPLPDTRHSDHPLEKNESPPSLSLIDKRPDRCAPTPPIPPPEDYYVLAAL
jgi:hypothetical protein